MRALFATLLVLAGVAGAEAQTRWLVVSAGTAPGSTDALRNVERALAEQGVDVVRGDGAGATLEAQLSAPYVPPPEALVSRLGVVTEQVLGDVARGNEQEAIDAAQPVLEAIEPHLAGLGREERSANDVGNLCYYVVRALLQKQDVGAARRQLDICLRLAPGFAPSERLHPPSVRDFKAERGSEGLSVLAVQVIQGEGCQVRVQGRVVGSGSRVRLRVPPGPYAVQVECEGRAGRLHQVQVSGNEPSRIDVDATLDTALRTDGAVRLVYPDGPTMERRRDLHLQRIARVLGARRLLVRNEGAWNAYDVEAGALTPLAAPLETGATSQPEAQRVAFVALGRRDPSLPPEDAEVDAGRLWIAGMMVTAVGLAGNIAGWIWRGKMRDDESAFDELGDFSGMYLSIRQDLDRSTNVAYGLGIASAGVLTIGIPMLLPRREGTPWWSWILGAAGAGMTAYGVVALVKGLDRRCLGMEGSSLQMECPERADPAVLSPLLLGYGVPLLLSPFVYLIRNDQPPRTNVGLDVGPGRAALTISGSF